MILLVPSIVELLINKIALRISVQADDWRAKRVIFASNGDDTRDTVFIENNEFAQKWVTYNPNLEQLQCLQ